AGPVAEEHHHVAAARRVIERVAVDLAADDEDLLVLAGLDERVGHLEAVHEAAALLPDVVAGAAALAVDTELRLQEDGGAREVDVGRERPEDDAVDVLRLEPGVLEGALGRLEREITTRPGSVVRDVVTLLDPRP